MKDSYIKDCTVIPAGGINYLETLEGTDRWRWGMDYTDGDLYEAEERFRGSSFVRISNSEMINLKTVRSFDLSLAGTICVSLKNGETAYVSRRYVSRIKEALGM